MKVALFCGGQGLRIRDHSQSVPKPLVEIDNRPILWNLMRYYAHFGYKDFVLCLGYRADAIKRYFLDYDECLTNDFVFSAGGSDVELLNRDIDDWKITFVDTGTNSNIGERLKAVQPHLEGEEMFMANYADGLSDLDLNVYVEQFRRHGRVAQMLSVPAPSAFHVITTKDENVVTSIEHVGASMVRVNGGFFVFRREIFDYIQPGEELVMEPFQRLIRDEQLVTYPFDGFWQHMDTFKDKQRFDDLLRSGEAPWQVWK